MRFSLKPCECSLIAQYDGSCLQPLGGKGIAGAGVEIWLCQADKFQLIDVIAISLPMQHTAPSAEAQGSSCSVDLLRPFVAQYAPTFIEMQGDNLRAMGFWNGASRIKQVEFYTLVSRARRRSLLDMPPIKVVHISRESNRAADFAAGIGAASLFDKIQEGEETLEPFIFQTYQL